MPADTSSEQDPDDSEPEFVEVDPTGRYGRYKEVLGKGAFKKVYRAFDEFEGIEVAWNQVKVAELLRNAEDLERLYSEVHLLKTLKHKNIIKFYNSWVDTRNEHINFITEIFTSGTLRQYRMKHKYVDLRALKKWSRQILEGLLYLHSHDPPVIHRDLKCDNVFVNGHNGEVKIGDLGLAAILHHANAAHSVIGTPEFMAPELYEEEYNELVDIYAFGMCVLELVTLEYPYAECCNAAQIYKKVTLGVKPASLAQVRDPSIRVFIEKCIAKVSERLSATQLLMDPFLSDAGYDNIGSSLHVNVHTSEVPKQSDRKFEESRPGPSRDVSVHGERKDVKTIFVKLRISDSRGQVRNIHFPFDIEADTSIAVASEMVHELDLTDQDVTTIADMIDSEIRNFIPDWSPRESSISDSLLSDHKYEASPRTFSENNNKDDVSPMTNASSGLFYPDRFPSGRKFWSDSPRAGVSPLKSAPMSPISELHTGNIEVRSFENTPRFRVSEYREECENEKKKDTKPELIQNPESGDLGTVVEKLEHVLDQQQKELDELKGKHESVISDILKELSPDIRQNLFNMCSRKIPDYKMQCEMNLSSQTGSQPSQEGSQATNQSGSRRERFKYRLSNLSVNNGVYHYPGASVDRIFAHTKTMIDVAISPRFFHLLPPLDMRGEGGADRTPCKDKLNSFLNGSLPPMNNGKKESKCDMGIAVVLRDSLKNNS